MSIFHYTVYNVHYRVHIIHIFVYNLVSFVSPICYTLYIVHCTLYSVISIISFYANIHCTLYSVHCTVYILLISFNANIHCTLYIVHCTLYSVHIMSHLIPLWKEEYYIYLCLQSSPGSCLDCFRLLLRLLPINDYYTLLTTTPQLIHILQLQHVLLCLLHH